MTNIMQDIINAVYGANAFDILENVNPNLLFVGGLALMYFVYLALRSVFRFMLGLGSKF